MQFSLTIIGGVVVFVLGQMLQQYILAPIAEFGRHRADAIYFVVRYIDLTNSSLGWDSEERKEIKQMKAALIYSFELIPHHELLSNLRIFGVPKEEDVREAATKIGKLAKIVTSGSGVAIDRDLQDAQEIISRLGSKMDLMKLKGV